METIQCEGEELGDIGLLRDGGERDESSHWRGVVGSFVVHRRRKWMGSLDWIKGFWICA